MSLQVRPTLTAIAILAATTTLGGSPASAAVVRDGSTFSPTTGAELLEAADAITAESGTGLGGVYEIRLESKTYAIDRSLVIRGPRRVEFTFPDNSDAPVITNLGAPGTLLRLSQALAPSSFDAPAPVEDGVIFRPSGGSTAAFPVVDIERGGMSSLRVDVPASVPGAIGVRVGPFEPNGPDEPPAIVGAVVMSAANAPAVQVGSGAVIADSYVEGGSPTVDLVDSPGSGELTTSLWRSLLVGASETATVVRAAPGARTAFTVASSIIDGTAGVPELVRVRAPTGGPVSPRVLLRGLTLDGTGPSTAIQVEGGEVDAPGLLSLGSATVVGCATTGPLTANVLLDGFYAEGMVGSVAACTVTANGRRTGNLNLQDRAGGDYSPRWGSPLIDAAPVQRENRFTPYTGTEFDVYGNRRKMPGRVGFATTEDQHDIGAVEYQGYEPVNLQGSATALDGDGLTRLIASAEDPNSDDETKALVYEWWFEGELVATGADITYRLPVRPWWNLTMVAKDESQRQSSLSLVVDPFKPAAPTTPDSPQAGGGKPDGPTVSAPGTPGAPAVLVPSRPAATQQPRTLLELRVTRKYVGRSTRRSTALGSATASEGELELRLSRDARLTLTAARVVKGKARSLPRARVVLATKQGTQRLRITARFGRATLQRGLYRVTVVASGSTAGPERRTVLIRVR
ncbi:MAG: hypothetical protein JHD16_15570 [Solirubrobacteraceae bacterium]|nr:hypothetical protein [Solirubrobacteraceae bacterium]